MGDDGKMSWLKNAFLTAILVALIQATLRESGIQEQIDQVVRDAFNNNEDSSERV